MPHVILNTNALKLAQNPGLVRQVERVARGRGMVWVTHTLGELDDAVADIVAQDADRVALCGGDGTFMAGLTALTKATAGTPPPIALLPAGTVATVARQWGAAGELTSAVDRFLRLGSDAPVELHATLRVEADDGVRYGFTFGTGLVARFFEQYNAQGAGGLATAAGIFARVFAGSFFADAYSRRVLDPLPCSLTVSDKRLEPTAYSLIVSSVLRDVGLGLRVTYRANEDPSRPHLVASSLSAGGLGPQATRVLAGRGLRGDGGFDGLVERFAVCFPNGEAGPYVFDGDLFRTHEVQVSPGPRINVVRLPGP